MESNKEQKEIIFKPSENKTARPTENVGSSSFWKIISVPALNAFIKSLLAGIIISIGAVAYISLNKEIFSPFIFALSFIAVLAGGYYLFADRASNFLSQNSLQNLLLIPVVLGNLLGAVITGIALQYTRFYDKLYKTAWLVIEDQLSDDYSGVFIVSVLCGLLIYIAGDAIKSGRYGGAKYLVALFAVMAFIYCRFDHSVTNAFYYTFTGNWNGEVVWRWLISTSGNALGAVAFPIFTAILSLIKPNNKKSSDK